MAMPEATVHKNNGAMFAQNDIWTPWQPFLVQSETKPDAVQQFSNNQLGPGVPAPNTPHDIAALLGGPSIHGSSIQTGTSPASILIHNKSMLLIGSKVRPRCYRATRMKFMFCSNLKRPGRQA
ncbi:MAG: hypothetical protein QOJ96_2004 [Alphaproteobacteria bacterium]|jgi:hypothetical protein|nr:hypothetical protein [Alphaproteobacteria bacterium]